MEVQDEHIWLQELERGEDRAYQILFNDYYVALSSFAYRYVQKTDVAEDIVQDILYHLWLRKLHFKDRMALRSYLYAAVRTHCLDYLKHQKVRLKYYSEKMQEENVEFFLNRILEEEVYLLLKKALLHLHGQTREVYELAFGGADNQQIAEKLGISMDAVKSLKKRGKKILQEKLKGYIFFFLTFSRAYFSKIK